MPKPRAVRALPGHRIWIRYDDGTEGEIDLADLAGRGVFELWNDPEQFAQVRIGPGGAISWSEQVDLCPDAMYKTLTGQRLDDMATHDRIEIDPGIMMGKPVIRGTRVPVELLLRKLGEGATVEDLLDAHPHLSREDIHAALIYAAESISQEQTS